MSRKRKRDIIDVRKAPIAVALEEPNKMGPTPEQRRHFEYEEDKVVDQLPGGRLSIRGRAWQKRPKFLTIAGLGDEQIRALKYYRDVFDRSEKSEMKSALDIRPRGNGGGTGLLSETIAGARGMLIVLEAGIGAPVHTLRAVALNDISFRDLAMQRYGSREVQRIDMTRRKPQVIKSIEPKSGKHRDIIRQEFMLAVSRLVGNVRPYLRTGD